MSKQHLHCPCKWYEIFSYKHKRNLSRFTRVGVKRGNGTDRRNRNDGTGKEETEKRVKRGKKGKTRKKG